MKKIILIIVFCVFTISLFFIGNVYVVISNWPHQEYGQLILKDRTWKIITDKWRSGWYMLPYTWDINSDLVKGIITIEDTYFYGHNGINIQAKISSLYQNLRAGKIIRGGSTITEQYIKNTYYAGKPRTILQKIREAIGALIIEKKYNKEEILRKYLSNVYMGNGLYGIENIIEKEWDNDIILDVITKIKYPNISDTNRSDVLSYRNRVSEKIGKKWENTHLFEEKIRISTNIFPIITNRIDKEIRLFCNWKKNILKQWTQNIPDSLCNSWDINLVLTIDSNLIYTIQGISRWIIKSLEWKNVTNTAILIVNPESNTILAYTSGTNPNDEIDMITRKRSVGSLLKPFIYRMALQNWADSEDYLLDDKTIYETNIAGKYFIPENYNPKSYGPIKFREALGNSLNSATVRLTDTLGISAIYNMLRDVWLILDYDAGHYGYGISLGTVEVTMENIVDSYRSLLDFSDPDTWQIWEILKDSRNRARTFGISSILNTSIPMSVKTGTSTDFRDNWTVSYHPDAIIGVWVGNSDGSPMGDISWVSGAWPIWHQIIEYMITKWMIKNQIIPPPVSLKQLSICMDISCYRKELMYTKKTESPKTRPAEWLYFRSDFFWNISEEEMERWKIR